MHPTYGDNGEEKEEDVLKMQLDGDSDDDGEGAGGVNTGDGVKTQRSMQEGLYLALNDDYSSSCYIFPKVRIKWNFFSPTNHMQIYSIL